MLAECYTKPNARSKIVKHCVMCKLAHSHQFMYRSCCPSLFIFLSQKRIYTNGLFSEEFHSDYMNLYRRYGVSLSHKYHCMRQQIRTYIRIRSQAGQATQLCKHTATITTTHTLTRSLTQARCLFVYLHLH